MFLQVTGTHLASATVRLNRGTDVALELQNSIGQHRNAIRKLDANAKIGVQGLEECQQLLQKGRLGKAWLTVGIPTVPRQNEADYLSKTLESILEELPLDTSDPLYANIIVVVMNNQIGNHSVFYEVTVR